MAEEPADRSGDEPSLELPSLRSALRRRRTTPQRVTTPAPPPAEPAPESAEAPPEPKRRRTRGPIRVPGPVAAGATGALVGVALVGLTSGALHLCTTWRGTSSCGKPGILLLLAITLVVTALGVLLLRLLRVPTATSTSLLGAGLLVVVVLLALVLGVDRGPAAVVPLLSALTYLAAWWLTSTYDEPGELTR